MSARLLVSTETDLSPYIISGYHMISTGLYASKLIRAVLLLYLNKKWEYKLVADETDSKLWERQIIKIFNPDKI